MEPKYIAIILAYVATATASPVSDVDISNTTSVNLVEEHRQRASFSEGELVFYGLPNADDRSLACNSKISERKASKHYCTTKGWEPQCSTKNVARNDVCDSLITELGNDGEIVVPNTTRSLCYMGDSEHNVNCCISWHNDVTRTLYKTNLTAPAIEIDQKCTESGISGKIRWVYLLDACTSICLSNRPGHC